MDPSALCTLIKENLDSLKFHGIERLVETYLNCTSLSGKQKASFAALFFQGTVKALQGQYHLQVISSEESCQAMVDSVLQCSDVYRKHRQELASSDSLLGEKFIYHIVKRLAVDQATVKNVLKLSSVLHCLLKENDSSDPVRTSIANNTHNTLWKLAGSLELAEKGVDFVTTAELRIQAVSFYTLGTPKALDDLHSRATMALARFDQFTPTNSSSCRVRVADFYLDVLLQEACKMDGQLLTLHLALPVVRMLFEMREWDRVDRVGDLLQAVKGEAPVLPAFLRHFQHMKIVVMCAWNDRTIHEVDSQVLFQDLANRFQVQGNFEAEELKVLRELSAIGMKQLVPVLPSALEDHFPFSSVLQLEMLTLAVRSFRWHRLYEEALMQSGKDLSLENVSERYHVCSTLLQLFCRVLKAACLQGPCREALVTEVAESVVQESIPEEVLEFYRGKVEKIKSLSLRLRETYYCGYMAVKLAACIQPEWGSRWCQSLYKMATDLLTNFCYADVNLVTTKVKQVHLWNVYRDAMGSCGCYTTARDLASRYCSLEPRPPFTSVVAKAWVQMKHTAFEAADNKAATTFLADPVSRRKKMSLLMLELDVLQSLNFKGFELEKEILNEMSRVIACPADRAKLLLRQVEMEWRRNPFNTESVGNYLDSAEKLEVDESDMDSMLVKGQLLVWRFLHQHMELTQKTYVSRVEDMFDAQLKGEELPPCYVHRNQELKALGLMEAAYEAWHHRAVPESPDSLEATRARFLISTCITYCKLAGRCDLAAKFLQLLEKWTPQEDLEGVLKELGMVAAAVLPDESDSRLSSVFSQTGPGRVLGQAKAKIRQGLIQEAYDVLRAGTEGMKEKKSRSNIFVLGIARRLASFCLEHRAQARQQSDDALKAAHQAIRYHTGVITSLCEEPWREKWTPGTEMAQKFAAVGEMLESYLHLSRLYRLAGEARWARCFLKEGFKVAHSFALPQWCALLCLEMTRMLALMNCASPAVLLWQWAGRALMLEDSAATGPSDADGNVEESEQVCDSGISEPPKAPAPECKRGRRQVTESKKARNGRARNSKAAVDGTSEKELERKLVQLEDATGTLQPLPLPLKKLQGWRAYMDPQGASRGCGPCLGSTSMLSLVLLRGLAWAEVGATQDNLSQALEDLDYLENCFQNLRKAVLQLSGDSKTSQLPSTELDQMMLDTVCLKIGVLAKMGDLRKAQELVERYENLPLSYWRHPLCLTFQFAQLKLRKQELLLTISVNGVLRDGSERPHGSTESSDACISNDSSSSADSNSNSEMKMEEETEVTFPDEAESGDHPKSSLGRKRGGKKCVRSTERDDHEAENAKYSTLPSPSKPNRRTTAQRGRRKGLQNIQNTENEEIGEGQPDLSAPSATAADKENLTGSEGNKVENAEKDAACPDGGEESSPDSIVGPSPPAIPSSCSRSQRAKGRKCEKKATADSRDLKAPEPETCAACLAESTSKISRGRGRRRQPCSLPQASKDLHTCSKSKQEPSLQENSDRLNANEPLPAAKSERSGSNERRDNPPVEQEVARHPDVFEFDEADTEDTKPRRRNAKSRSEKPSKKSNTRRQTRQPAAKKPEVPRSGSLQPVHGTPPPSPSSDCQEFASPLSELQAPNLSPESSLETLDASFIPPPDRHIPDSPHAAPGLDGSSLPDVPLSIDDPIEVPRIRSPTLDILEPPPEETVIPGKERKGDILDARGDRNLSLDSKAMRSLMEVWKLVRHFPPSVLYRQVSRLLALGHHQTGDTTAATFFLAESAAVTLRHRHLFQVNRRIRKVTETRKSKSARESESSKKSGSGGKCSETPKSRNRLRDGFREKDNTENLQRARDQVFFNKEPSDLDTFLAAIPEEWTVCQISTVSLPMAGFHQMLLTIYDRAPVTVALPAFDEEAGCRMLSDFNSYHDQNVASLKLTDCKTWNTTRKAIDIGLRSCGGGARLLVEASRDENKMELRLVGDTIELLFQTLLDDMQWEWLGPFEALLRGFPKNFQALKAVASSIQRKISRIVKREVPVCTIMRLMMIAMRSTSESTEKAVAAFLRLREPEAASIIRSVREILSASVKEMTAGDNNLPVILILDERVQHIPWESMPWFSTCQVTRMPSLYFLHYLLGQQELAPGGLTLDPASSTYFGRRLDKVFYILDPEKNLPDTHKTFVGHFLDQEGWEGVVQEHPSKRTYSQALSEYDLFIYCGHGTGCKFYHSDDIQNTRCRAISLLIGCSSARLEVKGQLEAAGVALSYCLGECPLVLGMLWDVTDKDIDRFLMELLHLWQTAEPGTPLLSMIPAARRACKLPFLIGAAPVVFGLPIVKLGPRRPSESI